MKNFICTLLSFGLFSGSFAQAAEFKIDQSRSRIQVDVKATGHGFSGDLTAYQIKATGDPKTRRPTSFALTWDFNDLKTGDENRDREMIAWLGGGKPQGSFKFSKFWIDASGKPRAQGELMINRTPQIVEFPYTTTREGQWITADGTVDFDYPPFKLPILRKVVIMTVDPKLTVRFHLVGKIK